ncbi:MAG: trehalose-6-phosphate synthase, partial [Nitrospirales bacterium]|nr:trehalose-6-phosphate synthase [Nitrospirales bacterium]
MKKQAKRLIIVSNRLPIICQENPQGGWNIEPSGGGLVTALDPVFKNRGGLWIGWPGTPDLDPKEIQAPLDEVSDGSGYGFIPVNLTQEERDNFYLGFSNEIIWPLFHDLQTRCNFNPSFFKAYKVVNRKFAEVIAKNAGPQDLIWIHDYHLLEVASELRKLKVKSRLAFFLHIPFPSLDIFLKLPWRAELMKGLMEFDVLGFQTQRDVRNFMQCVRMFVLPGLDRRVLKSTHVHLIKKNQREVALGSFPISIDYQGFEDQASDPAIEKLASKLREDLPNRTLIIGVDRLDYTKGIPYKLDAFRNVLERYPELQGKITLVQNVVPSREDIDEYHDLRIEIEQLVGEINGQFTHAGWVPIHYMFQNLDRQELLAFYRMAKIAMVTPLKDGMNLVAKE